MSKLQDLYDNQFENLAEIALSGDPKDLAVKVIQSIPEPQISLCRNEINSQDIEASWRCGDKVFLDYNPKFYLFRYVSNRTRYKRGVGYFKANKRFRHPVHNNGDDAITTNWWAGAEHDTGGNPLPPRVTEWVIPNEGEKLFLHLNTVDWVRTDALVNPESPLPKRHGGRSRFRGCSRSNTRHYFYLCVGVQLPNTPSNSCPITFGPRSVIFSLGENRVDLNTDPTMFDKYTWKIG